MGPGMGMGMQMRPEQHNDDPGPPHDPVDGDPAAADHGPARTHPAGAAREPGAGAEGDPARTRRRRGRRLRRPRRRRRSAGRRRPAQRTGHRRAGRQRGRLRPPRRPINQDWADHFNEEHRPRSNRMDEEGDKKHDCEQNMASRPQSLQDYLGDQLASWRHAASRCELVRFLITHLDENGYLRGRWRRWPAAGPGRWSRSRRRCS